MALVVAAAFIAAIVLRVISHEDVPPEELAKHDRARLDVARLVAGAHAYRAAEGRWPPDLGALKPRWVDTPLLDPWGGRYGYRVVNERAEVWCLGRDGRSGPGVGPDLDIWTFLEPNDR